MAYIRDSELSETALLRKQVADMNAEMRRRDVADSQATVARLAAEKAAADKVAADAAAKVATEELEGHRRSAWLNHRVDVARAKGNEAFAALLSKTNMLEGVPEAAWPLPGIGRKTIGSLESQNLSRK
jgi:hypothetical protein